MEGLPHGRKSMCLESTRLNFNPNQLKKILFSVWIIFKAVLLLFYVSVFGPRSMWDLKSTTKN